MPKMLPVNMSVEGVHVAGRLAVESPDAGGAIGRRAGQLDAGELQPQCQRRSEPWLPGRECGGKRSARRADVWGSSVEGSPAASTAIDLVLPCGHSLWCPTSR